MTQPTNVAATRMIVPRVTSSLAAVCLLIVLSIGPAAVQGVQPQPRAEDVELAAALSNRDLATATRLLAIALKEKLPLPPAHPAVAVLGPPVATGLQSMFEAQPGDAAVAARINNLGVALALRGWHQSAAVAFGGALITTERIHARKPWPSALGGMPSGLAMSQKYSATPNPAVVNIENLQRVVGSGRPPSAADFRYEFALGLLETASKQPSMQERLRAMAEVFPPVVSRALTDALREPSSGTPASGLFSRVYAGFAQYKGTFLRGLPNRRVTKPYEQGRVPPTAVSGERGAAGGRSVWDRGEIWDDRGVFGFNPVTRLRPGETLVDIYLVQVGDRVDALRPEYVAIIGGAPVTGQGVSFRVLSLGSAPEVDKIIGDFWSDLLVEREQLSTAALNAVATTVWKPLAAALPPGTKRVWVAPDGRLTQLPWQAMALLSTGEPAVSVAVIDSGDTIRESRPRPATPSRRILLAGNPEYGNSPTPRFARLPNSAAEIAAVADVARTKGLEPVLLQGAEATEPAVLRALPAQIVHLATHGEFRQAQFRVASLSVGPWLVFDPELRRTGSPSSGAAPLDQEAMRRRVQERIAEAQRSGGSISPDEIRNILTNPTASLGRSDLAVIAQGVLALSGANTVADPYAPGSPAMLTDVDLSAVDLTATDLVVLSACDLGQTEQNAFQGLGSMQSAVVVAGARSMVSSLWKVPDEETTAFMKLFYQNLLVRGLPRADALREAQQAASKDAAGRPRSPYLWAGWVLFGEGW